MNTRPDERLCYTELARQGARVERRLSALDFPRLSSIACVQGDVDIALGFHIDELGRSWVKGSAHAQVQTRCQRCLEEFSRALHVRVGFCIAQEPLASTLARELDVFTAGSEQVCLTELVEDDLLMAVPERLCERDPCEHAPDLYYPAPASDVKKSGPDTENPFSVLAALKDQADS